MTNIYQFIEQGDVFKIIWRFLEYSMKIQNPNQIYKNKNVKHIKSIFVNMALTFAKFFI